MMNHYTIKYENDEAFNNILYRNGWMHWQPMTPDAVFEDGGIYLLKDKEDGSVGLATWMQSAYGFAMSIDYLENKERFTHYARITEPK